MVIWLNGAFGSGKTTTAFELHRRIENSIVYDPEKIGYFLMGYDPKQLPHENFQDNPLWRKFNYELIKKIATESNGIVIIPMTIINEDYYHEIISKLRNDGIKIDHYVLHASKHTLIRRNRRRLCFKNSWAVQQIPYCVEAFQKATFENKIDTDLLTVDEIVERIAGSSNLKLLPNNLNPLHKWLLRKRIQIKHIRKL